MLKPGCGLRNKPFRNLIEGCLLQYIKQNQNVTPLSPPSPSSFESKRIKILKFDFNYHEKCYD